MPDGYKVVIPSLDRPAQLSRHPLLEHAYVAVHESQVDAYRLACARANRSPLAWHVHSAIGMPQTRNALFDLYEPSDAFMFTVDDDLQYARAMMTYRVINYTDAKNLLRVIESSAVTALDAGVGAWGYTFTPRPQERSGQLPFLWRTWVESAALGIIDRELRFDENLITSSDVDYALQQLLKYRALLQDRRYSWMHDRWTAGGISRTRSTEGRRSVDYLNEKWGAGTVRQNTKRSTGRALSVVSLSSLQRAPHA